MKEYRNITLTKDEEVVTFLTIWYKIEVSNFVFR